MKSKLYPIKVPTGTGSQSFGFGTNPLPDNDRIIGISAVYKDTGVKKGPSGQTPIDTAVAEVSYINVKNRNGVFLMENFPVADLKNFQEISGGKGYFEMNCMAGDIDWSTSALTVADMSVVTAESYLFLEIIY